MISGRQTHSQGPVPQQQRSYLSRRKRSVIPRPRGSRRPSLASEDGRSLCLSRPAIRSRPISPLARLPQCAARNPSSEDARRQKLALLRFTSLLCKPSLEQISEDDVTSDPPL